jgi:hypothetical protein
MYLIHSLVSLYFPPLTVSRTRVYHRVVLTGSPDSRLSLLPFDPPAFTLPEANPENRIFASKTHQPSLTLATYPLPDGNWRWVSKTWMVDMRSDAQVQYDGYEYNWLFRKHKWHSDIGPVSTGAWVRRRRWVRLMVKPAKPTPAKPHTPSRSTTPSSTPALSHTPWRYSVAQSSHPPSFLDSITETGPQAPLLIWEGVPEDDWIRCHDYLKTISRDGRKLEVWKQWFGLADPGQLRKKQWSQDDELLPSENLRADNLTSEGGVPPPVDFVVAVVQDHVSFFSKSTLSRLTILYRWKTYCVHLSTQIPGLSSS